MNKNAIQKFAVWARVQLIGAVKQRAFAYEITGDGDKPELDAASGRLLTNAEKSQRRELIGEIRRKGFDQVMEEAAYTWFNRFIALRFMEVNNYLPSKVRLFTDENGAFKPQILKEAMTVELDGLDRRAVLELLDKQENEALYKYLLITQCNALNAALPGMFEKIANWTELLFPDNLLRADNVLGRMISDIPEEDWRDAVQIIGWLYQYYISRRHEEVIDPIHGKTIKKEDIPAATQLFTTDWVVRYMVDNSLGRYWIERHPESKLAEKLEFFVAPKSGEIEYVDEFVKPEDVKLFDPCMGSGHILVYAFDVLIEIYKESGYTERDAAALIVQNNLFGLDIDDRASQLAFFSVMMKARSYDRRFFSRGIQPNIFAIQESNGVGSVIQHEVNADTQMNDISKYLFDAFLDAKELGSIITVEPKDYDGYIAYLDGCDRQGQLTMDDADWLQNTRPMLKALARQAKVLAAKYPVVCTNPPYLNKIEGRLKTFVTENYKDYSGDLFSVFIYRNLMSCKQDGYSGYMTPNVWMFIKTYEKLRNYIINGKSIVSLIQMAKGAFFKEATVDVCTFVLKNTKENEKGLYFRLEDFKGGMEVQQQKVLEALADKNCGYFYEADQSNFSKIPGSPVAYWASQNILNAFGNKTLGMIANPKVGLQTGENNRFTRLWYEIPFDNFKVDAHSGVDALNSKKKWFPYNKGGDFRKWYGNNDYVVNWENNGWEIKHFTDDKGKLRSRPQNTETYFHESITWSKISSGTIAFRYKPTGHIYDVAGTSVFADTTMLLYLAGFCNSCVAMKFAQMLSPTINYEVGHISSFPIDFSNDVANTVTEVVNRCISVSKDDWNSDETSWDFKQHPLA